MKKTVSLMLCLLLIFSSVNFVFADFGTTDSTNLASIKNSLSSGGTIYNLINAINNGIKSGGALYSLLNNVNSNAYSACGLLDEIKDALPSSFNDYTLLLTDIYNSLTYAIGDGNARNSWMQKLDNDLINGNNYINTIKTNIQSLMEDYMPAMRNVQTLYLPKIYQDAHKTSGDTLGTVSFYGTYSNGSTPWSFNYKSTDHLIGQGLSEILKNDARFYGAWHNTSGTALNTITGYSSYNGNTFDYAYYSTDHLLGGLFTNITQGFARLLSNFASTQTAKNWLTLNDSTFTATSGIDGLYKWLQRIQTPIARLSYVHASDEEIAAREKAAANQTAVVNNFIDSTGSGAAPASSFGSVASMSSGYSTNMNTDAQASGIWNIFNSNNFGWFSQETVNQLDTTVSTRKGSSDFDTPLLDQQIAEIYKELGVDVND